MPRPGLVVWQRPSREPLAVGVRRSVIEGALGGAAIAVVARLLALALPLHVVLSAVAWLWLLCWPAWRLRPTRAGGIPTRVVKGLLRALGVGVVLGLVWAPLGLLAQSFGFMVTQGSDLAPLAIGMAWLFLCVRAVVVLAVALGRRIRRRLRWQLIASHLAVIALTFVSIAAVGSAIAAGVFMRAARPDAPAMAYSVAQALDSLTAVSSASSLDPRTTQTALDLINNERVLLRGEPPLGFLVPDNTLTLPAHIFVLSPDGRTLAAATNPRCTAAGSRPSGLPSPPAAVWQRLRAGALAGERPMVGARTTDCPQLDTPSQEFSAARVTNGARHPLGVVVVQAPTLDFITSRQFFGGAVAIFSVATIVLLAAWSLPSLALAGAFGYLLARGLTRRLESVSRVATAIGAGDLAQRVPVTTHNEIGQLAETMNRMAAHLEATMSELERARARAVDALRRRQELVASISHELRTPLAIVQAQLDTLALRQPTSVTAGAAWEPEVTVPAETVRALQNEMDRLASLIDDLFALSRAETGQLQVRREPVDVAALVGEVAALMRPLAQREGMIALSVEAPPGLPPALADADRLRQIISNLVRNAVRHTPDGGIIILSVAVDGPWIVIAVVDTGEGIAPEHLPHIFERFYRADQARTRSSGGAGLGLAIVREFVELMGGRVTVESKLGEGSCFRVYLPRA